MTQKYRTISAVELDQSLVDRWRAIRAETMDFASPYFCPEFTQAVAAVRDDVRIALVEQSDEIVGFFPYQRGGGGLGRPVGGPLSDFHGVIAAKGAKLNVTALLKCARLSLWRFDHLVGDTCQFEKFFSGRAVSPQIDLSAGYAGFVRDRQLAGSDYVRKTEGLARKLSREMGHLSFTLHDASDEVFETLFSWKSAQYNEAGTIDVFKYAWTRDLLRRIAGIQSPEFSGLCSTLRINGKLIAVHMGMRSSDTFHYWFPVYDKNLKKFSTGIILLLRIAEALGELGIKTIDLGKGDALYKTRLMSRSLTVFEGIAERPSVLASVFQLRRIADELSKRGNCAAPLTVPLRAIQRLERMTKFR